MAGSFLHCSEVYLDLQNEEGATQRDFLLQTKYTKEGATEPFAQIRQA
jgi:hypothetical protein